MAEHKDEDYKAFLKQLSKVELKEEQDKNGLNAALTALSYDLPVYDLGDVKELANHLDQAKNWSDFPPISPKILENVVSLAGEGHSSTTSPEKGCIHFSNISHHLLVKLCCLAVEIIRNESACGDLGVPVGRVLASTDGEWDAVLIDENPSSVNATEAAESDLSIVASDGELPEHVTAAEQDDDSFVFESMDELGGDAAGNRDNHHDPAMSSQPSKSQPSMTELAQAYVRCCTRLVQHGAAFTLQGSHWFSRDGLESVASLVKEVWLFAETDNRSILANVGHEYLCLLLRMADLFPISAAEVLASVNRLVTEVTVPKECLTLIVDQFSLLSFPDMGGEGRREALRLFSDQLSKHIAACLSTMMTEVRRHKDETAVKQLPSACLTVGLAIQWGSPTAVDDLISDGIWRDLCCLASMSDCEWSLAPRHAVLSGCCRHSKLFNYAFRVPSLVSALPKQREDAPLAVEDFVWALLASHADCSSASQKTSYQKMLPAMIGKCSMELTPKDDSCPCWCLIAQLLELLTTVRAPLRAFLSESLNDLHSRVQPFLARRQGDLDTPVTVTTANDLDSDGEESGDHEKSARSPKWRQYLKTVLSSLKKLLDDDKSKKTD